MPTALLSPRMLLLHALAIVAVGSTLWLGIWQYGAWQDNREDKAAALAGTTPRPLDDVLGPDDPFPARDVGRPVSFRGTWLPEETVYVADKRLDGRIGYWVVTPVAVDGSAVLVVRGWTAEAQAPPLEGEVEVTGWLQPGESTGGQDQNAVDAVLPGLRIADVLERMDRDLYGGYVIWKDPAAQRGVLAINADQLPKPSTFTGVRNLFYAVEWWVFGGFAVFLWWRWCSDELERVRSVSTAVETGEHADVPEVPSGA